MPTYLNKKPEEINYEKEGSVVFQKMSTYLGENPKAIKYENVNSVAYS